MYLVFLKILSLLISKIPQVIQEYWHLIFCVPKLFTQFWLYMTTSNIERPQYFFVMHKHASNPRETQIIMNKHYKDQHPPKFLLQEKVKSHFACSSQWVLCGFCFLRVFWVVILKFHILVIERAALLVQVTLPLSTGLFTKSSTSTTRPCNRETRQHTDRLR